MEFRTWWHQQEPEMRKTIDINVALKIWNAAQRQERIGTMAAIREEAEFQEDSGRSDLATGCMLIHANILEFIDWEDK